MTLFQDVTELFAAPRAAEWVRVEKGHGRLERREIRTSQELVGYNDFPGLRQVAQIKKRVVFLKTGAVCEDTRYLLSSLRPEQASAARLLALIRGHWGIENRLFHVKDDSFGEDRQVLGLHRSGLVMSLLRATAINLLRGDSPLWPAGEPLTGRAQRVSVHPSTIITATN